MVRNGRVGVYTTATVDKEYSVAEFTFFVAKIGFLIFSLCFSLHFVYILYIFVFLDLLS